MSERAEWYPSAEPRYSDRPFPEYRYTPGVSPHPITDPRGHSYSDGDGEVSNDAVTSSDPESLFLFGVDLHNAGYWWEAHETWETVWLKTTPNTSVHHGLRGLIQVANTHLKLHQGRARAVARLRSDFEGCFDAALLHTAELVIHGLVLAPWVGEVRDYYSHVGDGEAGHEPDRFPYIRL